MKTIIAGSREGFSLADVHRAIEESGFQDDLDVFPYEDAVKIMAGGLPHDPG